MASITINGRTISVQGNNIQMINNRIFVDGVEIDANGDNSPLSGEVTLKFEGDLANVKVDRGNVIVTGNTKNVDAGGSVNVKGNVVGDVDAGGSVTCGDVGNSIDASGSVNCGNVRGNVDANGSVTCASVSGRTKTRGFMSNFFGNDD